MSIGKLKKYSQFIKEISLDKSLGMGVVNSSLITRSFKYALEYIEDEGEGVVKRINIDSSYKILFFNNMTVIGTSSGSGRLKSENGKAQVYIYTTKNNKPIPVGMIYLSRYNKYKDGFQINAIGINKKFRGKNLAVNSYASLIKKLNLTIVSDSVQSLGGMSIWSKLYKKTGVFVYGYNPNKKGSDKFFHVDIDEIGQLDSLFGDNVYGGKSVLIATKKSK